MKILFSLFIFSCTPLLYATDTHGYIAFWQHPEQTEIVTVTKTTAENASAEEAKAELDAFCQAQDRLWNVNTQTASGCRSVTALNNSCAAAAWPRAQGLLKHENVVVAQNPAFSKVAAQALQQCRLKYGSEGECALETVFCTSSDAYAKKGRLAEMLHKFKLK
ncbi:DUF4189 domain-containing protein [Neisseria sp. N177_16]|nr:DUF4189 domain-containing protein [Neisseria sp. N177_16]